MFWYGLLYFLYAFTQASVQVRLGMTADDSYNPSRDLIVFFIFAPIITIFYVLALGTYVPAKAFQKWANHLAKLSENNS